MSSKVFKKHRFLGLSLSGSKTARTHLAVVDYFPSEKKLFLSHLFRDIGESEEQSADTVLIDLIKENKEHVEYLAVDAPLTTPHGLHCKCPGIETCKAKEVQWMWEHYSKLDKIKRPNKFFSPYTERCVEKYISTELEHTFPMDAALGSNRAPAWARMQYLGQRLKSFDLLEVFPRVNVWRLGRELKISKTPLLFYKNAVEGQAYRQVIMDKWIDAEWLFIYSQDAKQMVKDAHVFEAVVSAFTAFLEYKKLCEKPPKDFPVHDGWIAFPKPQFSSQLKL